MLLVYILFVSHTVLAYNIHHKEKINYALEDAELHFENFIQTHEKYYNSCEKTSRFNIFFKNMVKINEMNKNNPHCMFEINQFADLTTEEFIAKHTGFQPNMFNNSGPCKVISDHELKAGEAPQSFDWRDHIDIPIKNQLSCACCWAFSATGNVEAQYAIRYKQPISLSEQQLLDCNLVNGGCKGGVPAEAFRYLIQAGGQAPDIVYPYVEEQQTCHFAPRQARVIVADCISFQIKDEEMIKEALYKYGPLATGADSTSFMSYSGGVYSKCTCEKLNHSVLIVGYGTDPDGKDFWVIKNSWGSAWGEEGFMRIERGINSCGILNNYLATSIIV